MSRGPEHHDRSTGDQPHSRSERDQAMQRHAQPNEPAPLTERRSLKGLGSSLIGLSCLIVAVTASAIAWEHFETAPTQMVTPIAAVDPTEVAALRQQFADMEDFTLALRSELDGLTRPGGVLPRVIEQLQNGRRTDASHAAVLQQLREANLAQVSDVIFEPVSAQAGQGRGPVQVSPTQSANADVPQRVIVTPQIGSQTRPVEQGQ